MQSRRPFDRIKSLVAVVVGIPLLAGCVFLLLVAVNFIGRTVGGPVAGIAFLLGVGGLIVATYKSYELVRHAGGR